MAAESPRQRMSRRRSGFMVECQRLRRPRRRSWDSFGHRGSVQVCRRGWKRERIEEVNAFPASFGEELAPAAAHRTQGAAVINPGYGRGAEEEGLELSGPRCTLQRQP